MVNTSMLLQMISALDTLEKLIPAEAAGGYETKKREWDALVDDRHYQAIPGSG